jgi:hypothetical protein
MKLRYKFIVRNVSGKPVAVAVGQDNEKFNGMIKLNPSGEVIFKMLQTGTHSLSEIVAAFAQQFQIPEETAKPAVEAFIDQLRKNELLDETE